MIPIELVKIETGEIIDVISYRTQQQQNIIEQERRKLLSKSNDNFIFVTYKACKQLNIDNSIFTQSDIARIIYIASYATNQNKLMITERTPMTRDKLFELMNLDAKFFNRFYNKLIKNNVLIEKEENLYFNEKINVFW